MAHRATPSSVRGFSSFYLLHGIEMPLPNSDNLKARVSRENPDHHQSLQNRKARMNTAYKCVNKAKKKAHENNKRLYDRRAKLRELKFGDLVYLYSPAIKPGRSRKFNKHWTGQHKITKVFTHLNYEIMDQKNKEQPVHVNRLKPAYNPEAWKPETEQKTVKRLRKIPYLRSEEEEVDETISWPPPLLEANQSEFRIEPQVPPDQTPGTPEEIPPTADTPTSEYQDPTYLPPQTHRSSRELQPTRTVPPITRSRARIMSQENVTRSINAEYYSIPFVTYNSIRS